MTNQKIGCHNQNMNTISTSGCIVLRITQCTTKTWENIRGPKGFFQNYDPITFAAHDIKESKFSRELKRPYCLERKKEKTKNGIPSLSATLRICNNLLDKDPLLAYTIR